MPKPSLAKRIATDPMHQAVIQLVGYLGVAYPIGLDDAVDLHRRFGKDKVLAAAKELLDFDADAKIASLKPGVRRLCRGLLGPPPEEWDEFYRGVENPPPNPYLKEMNTVARAVADAIRAETGRDCKVEPEPDQLVRRILTVGPPTTPAERPFGRETDKRLLDLLDRSQYELTRSKPNSVSFRDALRDIGFIVAELQRRDGMQFKQSNRRRPRHR